MIEITPSIVIGFLLGVLTTLIVKWWWCRRKDKPVYTHGDKPAEVLADEVIMEELSKILDSFQKGSPAPSTSTDDMTTVPLSAEQLSTPTISPTKRANAKTKRIYD